jgi:hypothetical protein
VWLDVVMMMVMVMVMVVVVVVMGFCVQCRTCAVSNRLVWSAGLWRNRQ